VQQAQVLSMQFDAVVANPPYMGGKGMNPTLKDFAKTKFEDSKADLFAMFIENGFDRIKPSGFSAMVTMQSWMFLSSYHEMREKLLIEKTLSCMVHMGNGVMGIAFGTAATVMMNRHIDGFVGGFSFCDNSDLNTYGVPTVFPVENERLRFANVDNFKKIPGHPIAYWVGESIFDAFTNGRSLEEIADPRLGMSTNDNGRFLRLWYEIDFNLSKFDCENSNQALNSTAKWYPYNKGGGFRKWYGNQEYVINYNKDGKEVKEYAAHLYGSFTRTVKNIPYFFRKGLTWSLITSGSFSARELPAGFVIGDAGPTCYPTKDTYQTVFAVLNSRVSNLILDTLNPTVNFPPGVLKLFPVLPSDFSIPFNVDRLVELSKFDWDLFETSWNFQKSPLIQESDIHESFSKHQINLQKIAKEIALLETENNKKFIEIYKLSGLVNPEVSLSEVTLQSNPFFKYGVDQTPSILAQYIKYDSAREFISYAIGCMMGRYSLNEPGLIYARAGNVGFESGRYASFPADADGIVPITDELWFTDDAPNRIREFLRAVWGPDTLEENMAWLAESLGTKAAETPDETIRRYIADKFFKDHLQTYKKRPIYWLFSSGKQGAFQALVYLHRYSEGTLARLRAEYVVPLTSKIQSRIEILQKDAAASSSTAARNKLAKEVEKLKKKNAELLAYDEQLRHYADMRITLDLDDGVKVNYAKFGDLLAEVKAVTGGASDE
jgi:type II restriction/modification system DNA methylase subunit YeeA